MLVSVIIPLYNKEECVFDTIQSVLNQTYKNIELVVIDDGSTDKSVGMVLKINDNRIRLIQQENNGVAYTRNRGVADAKGDYILFLDADDYLYPDAIETLCNIAISYPDKDVLCGNFSTRTNEKENVVCSCEEGVLNDPFKLIWEDKWNIRLGSFIMEKDSFYKTDGFVSYISIGEDTYFTNQLLQLCNIVYSSKVVMVYNLATNSLSSKKYPFERHIENYFLQKNSSYYQDLEEANLIFKHFFRGLIRLDFMFSIKTVAKFHNKFPLIFKSIYLKIWNKTVKKY